MPARGHQHRRGHHWSGVIKRARYRGLSWALAMLEARSIDLHYGAAQALRAVSLYAQPGEVTCVLGRNGVGKTSLLRALVGQHPVSSGSVLWEGADITN